MQEEAILLKSPGEEFRYSSSSSHKGEKLRPAENLGLLYIRGTQRERERERERERAVFSSIQKIALVC